MLSLKVTSEEAVPESLLIPECISALSYLIV